MSRRTKSAWDFGELFPPEPARRVLTVSELTLTVKRLLERDLGSVWVTGEVTNYRLQSSGHSYFTLKDSGAQLACVLFRGIATAHREVLEDGRRLILQGELTVYEPRGQYQLVVRQIEVQGVGALQLAFEKLKQRLAAQGWFAAERKRPLPRYAERVGIVTSPTGAALRDVLQVVRRRHPALEITLAPCRVQGEGAADEIAAAIRLLQTWSAGRTDRRLDVILVTRGGGSLEDLWAFNEETVARAVFESTIPVLSGVGHEIDSTICDFVADLRAATPTAAAELMTEGFHACRPFVAEAPERLRGTLEDQLVRRRDAVAHWRRRLDRRHPRRRLQEHWQRLDELQTALRRSARGGTRAASAAWQALRQRWRRVAPQARIRLLRERLDHLLPQFRQRARQEIASRQNHLAQLQSALRLLSPQHVLERGYSITTDSQSGAIIREAASVRRGQRLRTRVQHGDFESVVTPPFP